MLPLRDDNPTSRTAIVTLAIIALNVVAFLAWEPIFVGSSPREQLRQETFFFCHALIPYEVIHQTSLGDGGQQARQALAESGLFRDPGDAAGFQQYLAQHCPHKSWLLSVFTSMFLHAGWLHIGGNMLFLWVFGNNVEDKLGRIRYLLFYLASGIVASILQVALVHTGANAVLPNLGASGAIAGVLGAYLFMFPKRRVLTLVFFFLITFVYLPAYIVLGAWFVLQFFNGVAALSSRVNVGGGVAVWAHIGGFAFGSLMALLFFPRERFGDRPPPRRPDAFGRGLGRGRRRGWGSRGSPRGWDPGSSDPPRPDWPA
jgi:membrane associated rhomboid family serine protease